MELRYREQLPPIVAEELDQLVRELNARLDTSTDSDGNVLLDEPIAGMFFKPSNQSIPNGALTAVTFARPRSPLSSSPEEGGWNMTRNGENLLQTDSAGNLTFLQPPPVDGLYLIIANVEWAVNTSGKRRLAIYDPESGLDLASNEATTDAGTKELLFQNVAVVVNWKANRRLGYQVQAFQDTGGALNVVTTSSQTWAQITLVQEFTR